MISIVIAMIEKCAIKFLSKHQIETLKEPTPEEYSELQSIFPKYFFDSELTMYQMEQLKKFNTGVKEFLEELLEINPAVQEQTKGSTLVFHQFKY